MKHPMRTEQNRAKLDRRQVATTGRLSRFTVHWPLYLTCLILAAGTGCRLLQNAANVPGQAVRSVTPGNSDKPVADPVEVQQKLLRFADEYSMRMIAGVDSLRRGTNTLTPAKVLETKIEIGSETWSIAAGPNAVADLLDMTVFVTVTRMALEEYWQPKVFGETALPLVAYSRSAETEIWELAGTVLTPAQQAELRRSIMRWHDQNPLPDSLVAARALGFASQVAAAGKGDETKPGSVFSLLMIDPLAGVDPAVREIAQTRMFAERALFVTQKMPMLLRWQTELLSLNAVEMPAVQQVVSNSTQIATSLQRFAAVAEKLPDQVSNERAEILKALQSQEKDVSSLLSSGTQMSTSLNTTLTTFDALMKRFGVGETNKAAPAPTNAEPFRIQDYTAMAAQLDATAQRLTELLVTLDRTLGSTNLLQLTAQAAPVVQSAKTSGKEIVDYAFWKGVLLAGVVLLAALVYRFLTVRRSPPKP